MALDVCLIDAFA
ncbi:hypothetical protein F0Q18_18690 [Vibrio cholerae]|nr:hypothetical protein F0Q18_18690 [Vibrio cholerae]